MAGDADGEARVAQVAGRLAALLRTGESVPLRRLAVEVDALGAAAINALADRSAWTIPAARS